MVTFDGTSLIKENRNTYLGVKLEEDDDINKRETRKIGSGLRVSAGFREPNIFDWDFIKSLKKGNIVRPNFRGSRRNKCFYSIHKIHQVKVKSDTSKTYKVIFLKPHNPRAHNIRLIAVGQDYTRFARRCWSSDSDIKSYISEVINRKPNKRTESGEGENEKSFQSIETYPDDNLADVFGIEEDYIACKI